MKNCFTFLLVAILLLAACVRDKESAKSPEELAFEKVKSLITQMGYDTSEMHECSFGYVVEGDILITQEYLDDFVSKPQTRHTFNKNGMMVDKNNQKLNMVISGNSILSTYVSYATQDWNEKTDCNIVFDPSASMSMTVNFKEFEGNDYATLMLVSPPNSLGVPGEIKINTLCTYLPSDDQARYMILHAIGHSIGFGHTPKDYFDNTVSDPFIEGTIENDYGSIMVKESYPLSWTGISKYDIAAFKIKYPKKEPVPEPEPEEEIEPDFVKWEANNNFAISLKGAYIKEDTSVKLSSYIDYIGSSWTGGDKSKIRYIRLTSKTTGRKIYGKTTDLLPFSYGDYVLDCGVAFKDINGIYTIKYGTSDFKVSQKHPRITSNIDPANVEFITKTYRIKSTLDTNDPAWKSYTSTAKLTNVETGKEIILRPAEGAAHEFLVAIPERACYIATVTINNGSETKTGTLSIDLLNNKPTTPVYYKMLWEYEPYDANPVAFIKYYLEFYSDAACTKRIQSTPYCIGFDYKLWEYRCTIDNVIEDTSLSAEDTCVVPPNVSSFDLPLVSTAAPYGLFRYVYKYEIIGFGYM